MTISLMWIPLRIPLKNGDLISIWMDEMVWYEPFENFYDGILQVEDMQMRVSGFLKDILPDSIPGGRKVSGTKEYTESYYQDGHLLPFVPS